MAPKADSRVFEYADAMKLFILGQNKRVEAWFAEHWDRLDGITGPIHKSTVSKALCSTPVVEPVANALDVLFEEMRDDPWAWCKPPENIDDLAEYAPLSWWFKILHPPMSWTRFERMKTAPFSETQRELVQEAFDTWRDKLKAACDQFEADQALVRALESDENPEYQHWVNDGEWRVVDANEFKRHKDMPHQVLRRRVGNPGLHGRTPDEIGFAWALADATLTLPDVEAARLTYSRPRAVPDVTHFSEPVEPWNGQEFDGVEIDQNGSKPVKHKVRFYWDGQRYLVEDVEPFAWIKERGEWRETTEAERDLFETGMVRTHKTKAEFLARKDQWIDEAWASRNANLVGMEAILKPNGIERSEVEADFQVRLDSIDDELAADERREIARRRMAFKRRLRRRAA